MGVSNLPRDRVAEFLLQRPFFEDFPFFDVMVEVRQPAGQLGVDRRRRQMVDQDRVRAAADGRGLAQIVDDPGVDVGHGAQKDVRPIHVGKPRGLAGQDELGPVRAEMDHGVGVERLLQPEIRGQVIVRRRRVLVVNQPGVLGLAPQRLRQKNDVAQVDAGNDKERFFPVAPDEKLSRRLAPSLDDRLALFFRDLRLEPCAIGFRGNKDRVAAAGQMVEDSRGPGADFDVRGPSARRATRFHPRARERRRSPRVATASAR